MSYCTNVVIEEEDRVSLPAGVSVTVSGELLNGAWNYEGHAEVVYQLEERKTDTLELETTNVAVALVKAIDEGNLSAMLGSVRKQQQGLVTTEVEYDLRALFYCLGDLCSRTLNGHEWPTNTASRNFFEPYITSIGRNNLLIAPVAGSSEEVIYTVALAAAMAGRDSIYVVASQSTAARAPASRQDQRRYLHLAMRHLIADVTGMNTYGDHMFAFARGMMNRVCLRAHSDEGGWVRGALRCATYPKPRGLIDTQSGEFYLSERFAKEFTTPASFAANCYGILLQAAACVADSDPNGQFGMCTVMRNAARLDSDGRKREALNGEDARPSAYPDLPGVCSTFEAHAIRVFNSSDVNHASMQPHFGLPRGTFSRYFRRDAVDAHFAHDSIIPYLYVENGALLRAPGTVPQPGPKAGRVVELDALPEKPQVPEQYSQVVRASGHHAAGITITPYQHCGIRTMGLYYIASAAFNDGVSHMANVDVTTIEPVDEVMALARAGGPKLEDKVWIRPQCPIPAAGECHVGGGRVVLVTHEDRKSKFITGATGKVRVTCGTPVWHKVEAFGPSTSAVRRNITWDMRKFLPESEFSMRESMIEAVLTSLVRTTTPPNIVGTTAVAASTTTEHHKQDEPNPDIRSPQALAPPPLTVYPSPPSEPAPQVNESPPDQLGDGG